MEQLKKYKWPLITIAITTVALIIIMSIGFTVGILSEDPDGLERVLEDGGVHEPASFWTPLLSFISNDYVIGIFGIILSAVIIGGIFYLLNYLKAKKS